MNFYKSYMLMFAAIMLISTPLRCSDEITLEISSENTSDLQNSSDKPKDISDLVGICCSLVFCGLLMCSQVSNSKRMNEYTQRMRQLFSQYGVSNWEELRQKFQLEAISDAAPLYL